MRVFTCRIYLRAVEHGTYHNQRRDEAPKFVRKIIVGGMNCRLQYAVAVYITVLVLELRMLSEVLLRGCVLACEMQLTRSLR